MLTHMRTLECISCCIGDICKFRLATCALNALRTLINALLQSSWYMRNFVMQ